MPTKLSQQRSQCLTALSLGAAILLAALGCQKKPAAKVTPPPPTVTVTQVQQQTVPIIFPFSGTVQSVKHVDIMPRVTGYITERYFTEGTMVKEGEPLYLIDPRPFQAALDSATAQLERDQAQLVFWKSEVKRYTDLAAQNAASEQRKEGAIAREQEAQAAIHADQANIETAKLNLAYTRLNAPFEGRIQNTKMNVGQLVQEEKDILTSLVQMDPIYVVFNITRSQLSEIQEMAEGGLIRDEKEAKGSVKFKVLLPDGKEYSHEGTIDYISAEIDPTTDTLLVRGVIPNPSAHQDRVTLISGQYVPVRVILGENPEALLIPETALVESQLGKRVFVVDESNKIHVRKVQVGSSFKQHYVVTEGLKQGERVVVQGTQKVRPGITVNPQPAGGQES